MRDRRNTDCKKPIYIERDAMKKGSGAMKRIIGDGKGGIADVTEFNFQLLNIEIGIGEKCKSSVYGPLNEFGVAMGRR